MLIGSKVISGNTQADRQHSDFTSPNFYLKESRLKTEKSGKNNCNRLLDVRFFGLGRLTVCHL
jgi:hypothetical protein